MNLTLSADEETVRKARSVARRQGTSLNELVRRYLETLADQARSTEAAAEFMELLDQAGGDLNHQHWTRDEIHER